MANYSKPGEPYWAGCRRVIDKEVLPIARRYGVPVTSRKRGTALNGNTASDHNVWNKTADAVDLGTYNGAGLARAIAKQLGNSGWQSNSYATWNIKRGGATFRAQVLWGAGVGHGDHVHVGLKLVSGTYRERRRPVKPGQTARRGDRGTGVRWIKRHLRKHGYWPRKYGTWNPIFGKRTEWWVKRFQARHGLQNDGVVGPTTWRALRAKPKAAKPTPKPQPAPKPKPKPKSRLFADISNNNPQWDAKAYATKYDLIVMKASEGKTFQDPVYVKRAREARKAGLTVYSYHFARPSNNNGRDEAWNFCQMVKKVGALRKQDRYVLDWEDTRYKGKGDKWIAQFVRECSKQGVPITILYSGGWYLPGTISYWPKQADGKTALRYWHSSYSSKITNVPANAKKHLWAWQFTDGNHGPEPKSAPGIGRCDMNRLV
jgi:lysozyme